jgi:diacylglycerol kinase (ATP)
MTRHQDDIIDYDPRSNPYKRHRGFKRLWMATRHSLDGFIYALSEESAFRQELCLATLMLPWVFVFDFHVMERILLIASVALVLILELINSGIEAAIDRISFDEHSLSKRAKDYGSAAVLLALLLCGGIWVSLFTSIARV